MVSRLVTRLFAGGYGLLDRILEAPPLGVTEKRLQLPRVPVFRPVLVDALELVKAALVRPFNDVTAHDCRPPNALELAKVFTQSLPLPVRYDAELHQTG